MGEPKISLQLFDLSDVDDLMVWATDDRVSEFCAWDTYTSKEDAITFITNTAMPHPWFKAICIDNKPIGAISVKPAKRHDQCRCHMAYTLAHKYWGPYFKIESFVLAENKGSIKVLEKDGCQRDGILRDYIIPKGKIRDAMIYSFLSTDFFFSFF
ncbi:hypothetical protein MKW94_027010 [Papaver nudicaule]|uniref:N-acetyltransferase domain-containing protein n=1 Tax=Papaver nudicaule TaxID=74823 RepID=A0AA41S1W6_PAPNU|nr:hypothetical protein [Papaver nudicaule]